MKKLLFIILLTFLLVGCTTANNQTAENTQNSADTVNQSEQTGGNQTEVDTTATSGPDCYGPDIHPVGQSIADQFNEQTDYNQVMVWFCNGFQFDDILTALQTEELAGIDAEDLLEMLQGGLTWDEIWLEIGLTEE